MIYDFTMPRDKKPAAVNKNRTAVAVAVEDINEKNMLNFNNEILQVLKQVHPNIPITCGALEVMNTIITNMMLKLAQKSYKRKNKSKLSSKDIMSAVMELFPPQMAKLACTAARKALTNRRVTNLTHKMDQTMSITSVTEAPTDHRVRELSAIMDRTMSIK
jgi:anti-anti-sigma regulatory factor